MEVATTAAARTALCWVSEGVLASMNQHNAEEVKRPDKN